MEITIRKIGNSKGMVIPTQLLEQLNLDVGDKADLTTKNDRLIITPKGRSKYSLAELVAKCDQNAAMPQELIDWEAAIPFGNKR